MKKIIPAFIAILGLVAYLKRKAIFEEILVARLRRKMAQFEANTRSQREYLRPPVDLGDSRRSCPVCHESLTYVQCDSGIRFEPCSYCFPKALDEAAFRKDMADLYEGKGRILDQMRDVRAGDLDG